MKWIFYISISIFVVILFTAVFLPHGKLSHTLTKSSDKLAMIITSPAFKNSYRIPAKYTCDGANINPPLEFSHIPKEAKSLVLLVEDPDAGSGTFHHWSVYNMDPTTLQILENSHPGSGAQGLSDFGNASYGGPCPPSGSHHYHFKLYALDSMLDLSNKATFNEIEIAMENHVVSQAELIGIYSRVN